MRTGSLVRKNNKLQIKNSVDIIRTISALMSPKLIRKIHTKGSQYIETNLKEADRRIAMDIVNSFGK